MLDQKSQAAIAKAYLDRNKDDRLYLQSLYRLRESYPFANITKYENDGSARTEPRENVTESKYLEYSEIERKIEELEKKRSIIVEETIKLISELSDDNQKSVLSARYLEMLCWDDVAQKLRYSRQQVTRIHGRALLEFYKILRKAGKDE